jgi:hypothetical protein
MRPSYPTDPPDRPLRVPPSSVISGGLSAGFHGTGTAPTRAQSRAWHGRSDRALLGLKGDHAQATIDGRIGPQPKVRRLSMTERAPGALGAIVGGLPVRMPQELAELGEARRGHKVLHFPEGSDGVVVWVGAPAFVPLLRFR